VACCGYERRDDWLSVTEREFVAVSDAAYTQEQAKRDAQERLRAANIAAIPSPPRPDECVERSRLASAAVPVPGVAAITRSGLLKD
jgi:hypothetical protein